MKFNLKDNVAFKSYLMLFAKMCSFFNAGAAYPGTFLGLSSRFTGF